MFLSVTAFAEGQSGAREKVKKKIKQHNHLGFSGIFHASHVPSPCSCCYSSQHGQWLPKDHVKLDQIPTCGSSFLWTSFCSSEDGGCAPNHCSYPVAESLLLIY